MKPRISNLAPAPGHSVNFFVAGYQKGVEMAAKEGDLNC